MAAIALAFSVIIPAAAEPQPPPSPTNRWVVDWAERYCWLIWQNAGERLSAFALGTTPGTGLWTLRILNRAWPADVYSSLDRIAFSVEPAATELTGQPGVEQAAQDRMLMLYGLEDDDLEALAAASAISVKRNGEPIFRLSLPNIGRAMAVTRQCEESALHDWGVDVAARAALRTPPRGNLASVVTSDDYPSAALADGHQGTATIRLDIDREGRVIQCVPVVSSGHRDLDRASCKVATTRFRPTPAVGADGAPAASQMIASITWTIHRR